MTLRFWQQVGGTIVMEFHVVQRTKTSRKRVVDAIILPNGSTEMRTGREVFLAGQDVIVVQTKAYPMDLVNFGQVLGGAALLKNRFNPSSVRAVAVCLGHDETMERLSAEFGIEVVVFESLFDDVGTSAL